MRYFARVTGGMEEIAWREIGRLSGIQPLATANRRLDFDFSGTPQDLLALRSVDDVFAYVGELTDIDHTRASLSQISQGVAALDFSLALNACRAARFIPNIPTYTITASTLGRRNYNRFEIAGTVYQALARLHWSYIENAPDHAPVDLDIRVVVEQNAVLVGLRLGALPLHRRPYKLNSMPGSLKPPVAFCMCLLGDIQAGDLVLDPTCGAGTILIEAEVFNPGIVIGADLNADAVGAAKANIANAGSRAKVLSADARQLPVAARSVDCVIANLPWGKQVASDADLPALYRAVAGEVQRILCVDGRCVLLTDRDDLLVPIIESSNALKVTSRLQISLYGSHPFIYCLSLN